MSRCKQCNVEILDETERCPLCHSVLEPTIEVENMYPDVRVKRRKMILLSKIYLFVAIVVEAFLIVVNHYGEFETAWSLMTGLALIYGYLVIRFAILGKTGYIFKTIVLTVMAILVLVAIDFLSGYRGWSVRYVFPAAIIAVDAVILILMIVNRRNWQSYIMWQIFMILCSIVPMVLYLIGVIAVPYLALAALGTSVFLFLGTMLIGDRKARVELKRRFHIR